jgi:hypothetical protein
MAHHFQKHYTRDEARELLPRVRQWLKHIKELKAEVQKCEERLGGLMAPGCDLGGELVNRWIRTLAGLEALFLEFHRREIQIKDVERGREVFLCWEQDDEDIEFWHDLDAGYAGRERL